MMEYPRYKKVLFCTDFSENADYAFEYAYGIAKRDDGVLYILHVIPRNPFQDYGGGVEISDPLERMKKLIKDDIDKKFKDHYLGKIEEGVTFEIVTKSGLEDEEILKFAGQEKVDIIVIGSHGITGIARVYFGSVAEKVIQRSPFPVFAIPPRNKLQFAHGRF